MRKPARTRKSVTAATLVVVAMMALLPAVVPRTDGRQDAFAWEMFAEGAPIQRYEVETTGGTRLVEPSDVLSIVKADVDYSEYLPRHLCGVISGALAVRVLEGDRESAWQPCA